MRRVRKSSDHDDGLISHLPENVIHEILTLLPIKDAAKTAVLSSKWRRHWRSIPQLVFDDRFAPKQIAEPYKLILNIYHSLVVHDGPVTKFVLAIPGLTPCDEIDHLIVHLSGRGVQDFTLLFSREACGGDIKYKLPSSLFTARQLNRLILELCSFMVPPSFEGFDKLTFLELRPSDFFENFLPLCPLLITLKLSNCTGATKLELDAPQLQELAVFLEEPPLQRICFKRTPVLLSIKLGLSGDLIEKPDLVAFFASLPALETFSVLDDFLKVLAKGADVTAFLPTPLRHLRALSAYVSVFDSLDMLGTSQLNPLANNNAGVRSIARSMSGLLGAEDDSRGCVEYSALRHLQVFEIKDSHGTQVELELVRFVLATAPLLQRIRIKPHPQLGSRKVTRFMKEVLQYTRISKEAKVIYDWKDEKKIN